MERSHPLQSATCDKSLLLSALNRAGEAIRLWQSRRRAAKVGGELSEEQLLDCWIQAAELNMPFFEVPRGLMDKLMSLR
jgi:hypothetical protein